VYRTTAMPSHDPEDLVDIHELFDGPTTSPSAPPPSSLYPYPNTSSFRLGDWYWNKGAQKSQEDFKTLLNIVGDPEFNPQDVRDAKWSEIDATLAANDFDADSKREWHDKDAGWKRKPVTIDIPFHNRMKNPGTQKKVVCDLYYRSIIDVIKEKLRNPADDARFHYEPYDLRWRPTEDSDEARVYGELYTSAAFQEAHRDLQESAGEPGCDLPRVVVALMFSSDATHLTTCSDAKLWPCYMYFGNESKYRRFRPSCRLSNHIAYFQKVSFPVENFFRQLAKFPSSD
jgi:hypothetical protein